MSSRRILVFRIGSLGDTIIALPAFWALHDRFPEAEFTLLANARVHPKDIVPSDLLPPKGLFSDIILYPSGSGRTLARAWTTAKLVALLRVKSFDAVFHLGPPDREPESVRRDGRFFAAAGIRKRYGFQFAAALAAAPAGEAEGNLILRRLEIDGLGIVPRNKNGADLLLSDAERHSAAAFYTACDVKDETPLLAFVPSAKITLKQWPLERFVEVARGLVADDPRRLPVVFVGPEEHELAVQFCTAVGKGIIADPALSLRVRSAMLRRARICITNDTGLMHVAAAVETPCVAIFASHLPEGRWHPRGNQHVVFRTKIACENCYLSECVERARACLLEISAEQVLAACRQKLATNGTA